MSQKWSLSQSANKSSGTCSICITTRQIHFRDGTINKHGPRHSRVQDLISLCFRLPVLICRPVFRNHLTSAYLLHLQRLHLTGPNAHLQFGRHLPLLGLSTFRSQSDRLVHRIWRLCCLRRLTIGWKSLTGDIPFSTNPSAAGCVTTSHLSSNAGCRLILQTAAHRTSLKLFSSTGVHCHT